MFPNLIIMKKQLKLSLLFLVLFFVFAVLHNAIYAVFKFEEGVAFTLALVSGGLFIGSLLYSLFLFVKNKYKK